MTGDDGAATPPGWERNPSTWSQRIPIALIAVVGAAVAGYLSAYQLGWVDTVWEPFFGSGTREVLESPASRILPVPDAVLGLLGYIADAVTGVIGGRGRWRTMPWIVILFGIAVGPLGATSILLVVLQPVAYDAFCTLCLASAVISVVMIGPAMDEVLASMQHVRRTRASGASWWDALVHGGAR